MFAFNITDELDAMRRHHDAVLADGGTCVMVSLNTVGLAGVHAAARATAQLPIHGHRNGWGISRASPALGLDFAAYQKLWRLAGVDHLHVNGLRQQVLRDRRAAWSTSARAVPDAGAATRADDGDAGLLLRPDRPARRPTPTPRSAAPT